MTWSNFEVLNKTGLHYLYLNVYHDLYNCRAKSVFNKRTVSFILPTSLVIYDCKPTAYAIGLQYLKQSSIVFVYKENRKSYSVVHCGTLSEKYNTTNCSYLLIHIF